MVEFDSYQDYSPHSHRKRNNEPCLGCIQNAYHLILKLFEESKYNYSNIRLVFSGRKGFHILVFDFMIADWTHIDEKNMLKCERANVKNQLERPNSKRSINTTKKA